MFIAAQIASQSLVTAGWVLISLYAVTILFFVVRAANKTTSIQDYALGSIAFSPITVGLSLAASITSAATFIINPGFVAVYGISGVISMGLALPIAAITSLVVLTKGFRKHGSTVKAQTMAQWMQSRYNSATFGRFFGILSLLMITFLVLIAVGLTKVLSSTLNISEFYALCGIVVFVFGYMMFGGANSMVYTNTIQAVLMLMVAIVLLSSGYEHFSEGVHGFMGKLAAIDPKLATSTNTDSFLFRDFYEIIFCQVIVGIAIICQPHILTKSLLLKKESDVNTYLWVGGSVQLLFFLVVITGLYIRISFPDMQIDGSPIPLDGLVSAYVVKEFPVYIGLVVVMGLISAGLSTLEGLIQSLSTTISQDLLKPLASRFNLKDIFEVRAIFINRVVIVALAVVTILISWNQLISPKLSVGIFAQNGVYAYFSAAFVPIFFGMFFKKTSLKAVFASAITAVLVHFSMYYGQLSIPFTKATGENPGVAASTAILASIVVVVTVSLVFDKKVLPETRGAKL
jgi:sodium/pantothenate symporter